MVRNKWVWVALAAILLSSLGVWLGSLAFERSTEPTELVASSGPGMQPLSILKPLVDSALDRRQGPEGAMDLVELAREIRGGPGEPGEPGAGRGRGGREMYSGFADSAGIDQETIPRLKLITMARDLRGRGAKWTASADQVVGYSESEVVEDLKLASRVVARVALWYRVKGRPTEARDLFESEILMGEALFQARRTYAETSAGLGMMGEGVTGLKSLAKMPQNPAEKPNAEAKPADDKTHPPPPSGPALEKLEASLAEINRHISEAGVWEAISSIDPDVVGRHVADVMILATKAPERIWRVEATLKLGRMRFDVGQTGTRKDQKNVNRLLEELVNDSDPAVALAATKARTLTVEEYRMLK